MDIYALNRREVASIIFKHARLLGLVSVVTFLVFFLGSYALTSSYKAETQVLVQSGREFQVTPQKGEGAPAGVPYVTKQEIINSEVVILNSREFASSVISAVGLARLYPRIAGSGKPASEQLDSAIGKFSKDMKASAVSMSNIITIDYWNPDRDIAIEALRKLMEIYGQRHAEIFGNRRSGFLNEQTKAYETQLQDLTQKITTLKNEQHLSDITYEREQLIQDRSEVEAKLRDLTIQSIDADRAVKYYQQELNSMPELVLSGEDSADAIEASKSRLLDLQTQVLQMKQRYSPSNTDAADAVSDLENQIAGIKTFIADPTINQQKSFARNLTYDDGRLKLQNAKAAGPALEQKIAFATAENKRIQARLEVLDAGEASLDAMQREQGVLRGLVQTYRDRYEEARSDDLDKLNDISVSVVHPPDAKQKPDKPKHLTFAAVGIAVSLLATSLILLYLLVFHESIITVESLERTLGLRVFGAIRERPA